MKHILLMGGARINTGDYLFEKRTQCLTEHFIPDARVTVFKRTEKSYDNEIEILNGYDAILFAGGPIYTPDIYPRFIPFVEESNFNKLRTPVFFVGGGLWSNVYRSTLSLARLGVETSIPTVS